MNEFMKLKISLNDVISFFDDGPSTENENAKRSEQNINDENSNICDASYENGAKSPLSFFGDRNELGFFDFENHSAIAEEASCDTPNSIEGGEMQPGSNGMKKTFDCTSCEKKYVCGQSLRRHFRMAHLGLRFDCPLCEKYFNCRSKLTLHTRTCHSFISKKTYDCSECEKKYTCRQSLRRHFKSVHLGIRFNCELCEKHFDCTGDLKTHTETAHSFGDRKMFDCPECGRKYAFSKSLKRHYRSVHTGLRFSCVLCDKNFVETSSLKCHIGLVHSAVGNLFNCAECEKKFPGKKNLYRHIRSVHSGIRYYCELCGKSFVEKSNLKSHIQSLHLGIKILCKLCGKNFSRKFQLKEHEQSVHSGVQFTCNVCDKKFSYQGGLKRHLRLLHNSAKRYKCNLCEQFFDTNDKLYAHTTFAHYERDLSGDDLNSRQDLTHFATESEFSQNELNIRDDLIDLPVLTQLRPYSNESLEKDSSETVILKDWNTNSQIDLNSRFGGINFIEIKREDENEYGSSQNENLNSFLHSDASCHSSSTSCSDSVRLPNQEPDEKLIDIPNSPEMTLSDISSCGEIQGYEYSKCRECAQIFYSEEDLAEHVKIHDVKANVNDMICLFCAEAFSDFSTFQNHVNSHFQYIL